MTSQLKQFLWWESNENQRLQQTCWFKHGDDTIWYTCSKVDIQKESFAFIDEANKSIQSTMEAQYAHFGTNMLSKLTIPFSSTYGQTHPLEAIFQKCPISHFYGGMRGLSLKQCDYDTFLIKLHCNSTFVSSISLTKVFCTNLKPRTTKQLLILKPISFQTSLQLGLLWQYTWSGGI